MSMVTGAAAAPTVRSVLPAVTVPLGSRPGSLERLALSTTRRMTSAATAITPTVTRM